MADPLIYTLIVGDAEPLRIGNSPEEAPPGLPDGDKAVFRLRWRRPQRSVVLRRRRHKACTPMNAPPALLSPMDQVAVGDSNHQRAGLYTSLAQLTNGRTHNELDPIRGTTGGWI